MVSAEANPAPNPLGQVQARTHRQTESICSLHLPLEATVSRGLVRGSARRERHGDRHRSLPHDPLKGSVELSRRIVEGARIPGDEMYFRSTPYFETSASNYLWLNDIVCVGTMREFGGGDVVYDLFEVL